MKVTVFIDRSRLMLAYTYDCFRIVLEIHIYTSVLRLNEDESYEMLRDHRMRDASHLDFQSTSFKPGNERNMLLLCCINSIRDKLLHLFTTTYHRNLGIHHLDDDIAAMASLVKLDCHILLV